MLESAGVGYKLSKRARITKYVRASKVCVKVTNERAVVL